MSGRDSKRVYCKVRVSLMRTKSLPSRVEFKYKMDERSMGHAEKAIARIFLEGLHHVCDVCRRAMRELHIAVNTAERCPSRAPSGVCKETSQPCNLKCRRVASAINDSRMGVNSDGEKEQ